MTGGTVDLLAALQRQTGRSGPVVDRRTPWERLRDEHLESVAEDRAFDAAHGGRDEEGDEAAARWENRLQRQWESVQP